MTGTGMRRQPFVVGVAASALCVAVGIKSTGQAPAAAPSSRRVAGPAAPRAQTPTSAASKPVAAPSVKPRPVYHPPTESAFGAVTKSIW